jgi:hypothetical protein
MASKGIAPSYNRWNFTRNWVKIKLLVGNTNNLLVTLRVVCKLQPTIVCWALPGLIGIVSLNTKDALVLWRFGLMTFRVLVFRHYSRTISFGPSVAIFYLWSRVTNAHCLFGLLSGTVLHHLTSLFKVNSNYLDQKSINLATCKIQMAAIASLGGWGSVVLWEQLGWVEPPLN